MEILSEEQIRQRISDISKRYPDERTQLQTAYAKIAKKKAMVHLAITFKEPDALSNEDAKAYLQTAIATGLKLTESDKEALTALELQAEQIEYDLAKFNCETSEKDFKQLEPQLSFYQSLMKIA